MDSRSRHDFLEEFRPGGKYSGVVGIYRENTSAEQIGIFDKELVNGLSSSVKWIAHNGAGYDPVDVQACISRGIQIPRHPSLEFIFCTKVYSFPILLELSTKRLRPQPYTF
jgi:glyoxylate reductase